MRVQIVTGLLLALTLVARVGAKELYEQRWIELRTPHFVLLSTLDADATRELAASYERARAVAQTMTNARVSEAGPTPVYVFPRVVVELGLSDDTPQRILATPRGLEVLRRRFPGRYDDWFLRDYMQRYAQLLVRGRDQPELPLWFEMGYPWLISQTHLAPDEAIVGQRSEWLVRHLTPSSWFPMEDLLSRPEGWDPTACDRRCQADWRWQFFAQGWLLTHYLVVGGDLGARFDARMDAYLEARRGGQPPLPAFTQTFTLDPAELKTTLIGYMSHQMKSLTLDLPAPQFESQQRTPPPAEIAARIGLLLLDGEQGAAAARYLQAAGDLQGDSAFTLAALARLRAQQHRDAEAVTLYDRALVAAPQEIAPRLAFARYLRSAAGGAAAAGGPGAARAKAAQLIQEALALDADDPDALVAFAESAEGTQAAAAHERLAALERARGQVPYSAYYTLKLAEAYARADRLDDARGLLRRLVVWEYESGADETGSSAAAALLQGLGGFAAAPDTPTAAAAPPAAGEPRS